MGTEPDGKAIEPLLLTINEVAAELRVHRTTVYHLDQEKRIPAPVVIGSRKRWSRQELADWIKAGCPKRDKWERTYRP